METLFVGRNFIELEHAESTNTYAIEKLRGGKVPDGTVYFTKNQTSGRGQRGNTWVSEPNKNAAFSIVVYPKFISTSNLFLLNKIASLAVSDFLSTIPDLSDSVLIKWPNDILVGEKKICGILIENQLKDQRISSTVIGIGININQEKFDQYGLNATSLKQFTGDAFKVKNCVEEICSYLEARYLQASNNGVGAIDEEYLEKLYGYNEWIKFELNGEIISGMVVSISSEGKLCVLFDNEEEKMFDFKEIKFVI